MTEDRLIKWGWFLWGCDRRRYPVTWREFERAARSQNGGLEKWLTKLVIHEIDPPPAMTSPMETVL